MESMTPKIGAKWSYELQNMISINLIHDPAYQQYVAEFEQFQRTIAAHHGVDPYLVRPTNGAIGLLHALFSVTRIAVRLFRPLDRHTFIAYHCE